MANRSTIGPAEHRLSNLARKALNASKPTPKQTDVAGLSACKPPTTAGGLPGGSARCRATHLKFRSLRSLWPAIVFLPILVAGRFKSAGWTTILGIDTTLASMILLMLVTAGFIAKGRMPALGAIKWILALFALTALSLVVADPNPAQDDKAVAFFLLCGPCILATATLICRLSDLRAMLVIWVVAGVVVTSGAFLLPASRVLYGRLALGTDTLGTAYLAAGAAVLALFAISDGWMPRLVSIGVLALTGSALVLNASRGPVIGFVAGAVWWLVSTRTRLTYRALLIAFLSIIGVFAWAKSSPETSRLASLDDPARSALRDLAWSAWAERPLFGNGFGSFAHISQLSGQFRGGSAYPHNLFAEVAAELGAVGLAVLATALITGAAVVLRNSSIAEVRATGGLALVWLIGQQFSSDLTNRYFWLALCLCFVSGSACRVEGGFSGVGSSSHPQSVLAHSLRPTALRDG